MKHSIPYRIVIIGGNHINTLSVIRCLGECNCDIYVLIHENQSIEQLSCANTRFSKGKSLVISKSEDRIIEWLLSNKKTTKQILFPCSDFAAYVIDNNYDILKEFYFLPGFLNQQQSVCCLMSKWEQYIFSKANNILMAKSWLITKENLSRFPTDILTFPCIIKPDLSAKSKKTDISICYSKNEIENLLEDFEKKSYDSLIVQEFIDKSSEYIAMGFITDNRKTSVVNYIQKIFEQGGGTVYAKFETNPFVKELNEQVIAKLRKMGYRGMFDIEYMLSGGKAYLNEINFRHSGVGFGTVKNKVFDSYLWCLEICGLEVYANRYKKHVKEGKYLLSETVCFNHRKEFKISAFKWICMCLKSGLAKFDIHDLRGTFFLYKNILHRR